MEPCPYISMITIQCKYNSVLKLRAGQLGGLVKYTSRFEENKLVSNRTNLICTKNKYCKYKYTSRLEEKKLVCNHAIVS